MAPMAVGWLMLMNRRSRRNWPAACMSQGMNIEALMTPNPACCTPETSIQDVARLMLQHDCGEIPVVARKNSGGLIGVVTDRDIVVRLVARGEDVQGATAATCMTQPAVSLRPDARSAMPSR